MGSDRTAQTGAGPALESSSATAALGAIAADRENAGEGADARSRSSRGRSLTNQRARGETVPPAPERGRDNEGQYVS